MTKANIVCSQIRIFDSNYKTVKIDFVKPEEVYKKYSFGIGGFETIVIWKIKSKK